MTRQSASRQTFTTRSSRRSAAFAGNVRVIEHVYSPGDRQDKHAHSYASISVVLAGSLSESVGNNVEDAFPLSVVVKPGDTEHADRFGTVGARMFSVQFEPPIIQSLIDGDLKLNRWQWIHGGALARWMLTLLQTYRRTALPNEELEDTVYEVLASLPTAKTVRASSPPRWLERVRQELDETFSAGVRVCDLAAQANVHPVYLARVFRRYVGCSITDYRTLLKARAAAELLASSGVTLATAAHDCGFADQSHMGRSFKSVTGLTPRDYRTIVNGPYRRAA
ncbi:MAG TPA: AraC family transcriptional regulator [Pyrinomonadaceae bacterium]